MQQEIPEAPPPPHGIHRVFIGADGLRAGWSALLFVLILTLLIVSAGFLLHSFVHSHPDLKAPLNYLLGLFQNVLEFVLIFIATAVMAAIEHRPIRIYGYAGSAKLARFLWGIFWGFVAISFLVGTLWKLRLIAFDGFNLHGPRIWKYAAAWAVVFFFVGLAEESLLRGYLQYTLTRGLGFWWAALLLSVLFGLLHGHNPGESPVGLFSAGAVGLVFCLSLWYTGSLWWAIGFHAAWDWGQSYFYGTADSGTTVYGHLFTEHPVGALLWSGGPTGPEGSLLIFPLLVLMALAMWLWWGRAARPQGATAGASSQPPLPHF